MATKTTSTTDNNAGCSPCTPEAHQRSVFQNPEMNGYSEHKVRKTARADVHLRFYKLTLPCSLYVVQQIYNLGIHDRRKSAGSREQRIILIKTADRAEAVATFNKKMEEIGKEMVSDEFDLEEAIRRLAIYIREHAVPMTHSPGA